MFTTLCIFSLDKLHQMSTAVKEREFRDVVAAEGMVRDIKARSYNRKPRYLKERPVIRDNSPDKNGKFTALTAE